MSVAISRALEASCFAQAPLERPLLDIGCGFGEFGSIFLEAPADVGIDVNRKDLNKALRKNVYRSLSQADARCLPFLGESFAAIISVSTLEHIPGVEGVLSEAFRVLRPGGVFLFTVPSDKFSQMLAVPRMFSALHAAPLGRVYARAVNSSLGHVTLWDSQEWRARVERAGFEVECCQEIMSPRATFIWDIGLVFALPERFWRIIMGRRLIKPAFIVNFLHSRFATLEEKEGQYGSNLFVVARKPGPI